MRAKLDARLEVGAVIEVESAKVVLVGLSVAAVLREHHARHVLEQFALARERAKTQVCASHPALRRALCDTAEEIDAALDADGRECGCPR